MKDKLVAGMFADVFQQRDWMVDRRFIKPANDVSRTQSGRGGRCVRFRFVDDRCLGWRNEQLAYTFPSPSTSVRVVRLHPNGLDLSVSLEFYGDFVAFAAHYIPDDAVVHSRKPADRFVVN